MKRAVNLLLAVMLLLAAPSNSVSAQSDPGLDAACSQAVVAGAVAMSLAELRATVAIINASFTPPQFKRVATGGARLVYGAAAITAVAICSRSLRNEILKTTNILNQELEDEADECTREYRAITGRLNLAKERYYEYQENSLDLPEIGPYPPGSRKGHRDAFRDVQRGLRNWLERADDKNCKEYEKDAWYWATRSLT